MAEPCWRLYTTDRNDDWEVVGAFASLAEAAHRILILERSPVGGLFLETHVAPDAPDADVLALFQYTGTSAVYAIRREDA